MKRLILILFASFLVANSYCQTENIVKKNIETIDSIAKANKISFIRVMSNSDTNGDDSFYTKKGKFEFIGNFLVLNSIYYNLDKLLYFYIKDEYIVIVLQRI